MLIVFFKVLLRIWQTVLLREDKAAKMIKIVLALFFIKSAYLEKAFVDDVYMNKRFHCQQALKTSFIAKSQIQCVQLCSRKRCKLINYNMNDNGKENCEIFTETGKCSTVVDQESWIAMAMKLIYEVNLSHILV